MNVTSAPASTRAARPGIGIEQDFQTDVVTIPLQLCNLPPLHSIANQVLALSADPDIDLKRIASVMEGDPAFAAEILFLANSSLFGFPSRMHVLRHAVAILGLDRIKALAVTVAMRAFLGQGGPLVRQCWRHSAACAMVAEEISAAFDYSGDRAYTAGLMHDIGRLGLLKSYPKESAAVLSGKYESFEDLRVAERNAFGVEHGLAGAWLVRNWAYPETFTDICAHHHCELKAGDSMLLQMVRTACRIADALGFQAVKFPPETYDQVVHSLSGFVSPALFPPPKELQENVEARLRALGS